jgi:hypothetical protein
MGALEDIAAERKRQIEVEGWSTAHDDHTHPSGELSAAAACYALSASAQAGGPARGFINFWPWQHHWFKPSNQRRSLIKAASLIVAEIERIDREG